MYMQYGYKMLQHKSSESGIMSLYSYAVYVCPCTTSYMSTNTHVEIHICEVRCISTCTYMIRMHVYMHADMY